MVKVSQTLTFLLYGSGVQEGGSRPWQHQVFLPRLLDHLHGEDRLQHQHRRRCRHWGHRTHGEYLMQKKGLPGTLL